MSPKSIRVENLSKRYRVGQSRDRYVALRDVLTQMVKAPLRAFRNRNGNSRQSPGDYFWALKNICLEFEEGEIVGVIGRNGAGKTTLLKILTRITRPTSGRATVRGRVGSLLEVGTGFHPELTGRENIYFYGAILGMGKKEIERKYDEIIQFAGVEAFIDTPLKHFSTGMQSRLAFAVAAHLEPEILLVDEVLAVGDLEFQRKCLGRMEKVSQGGRTVVLVSHQLNQIRRLCRKVVWMDRGQVREVGPPLEVTGAYEAALLERNNDDRSQPTQSNARMRLLRWEIGEPRDGNPHVLESLGPAKFKFKVEVNQPVNRMHIALCLYSPENQLLWGTSHNVSSVDPGVFEFVYDFSIVPVKPGAYRFRIGLADDLGVVEILDCRPDLLVGTEPLGHLDEQWAGLLNVPCELSIQDQDGALCRFQAVRGRIWT